MPPIRTTRSHNLKASDPLARKPTTPTDPHIPSPLTQAREIEFLSRILDQLPTTSCTFPPSLIRIHHIAQTLADDPKAVSREWVEWFLKEEGVDIKAAVVAMREDIKAGKARAGKEPLLDAAAACRASITARRAALDEDIKSGRTDARGRRMQMWKMEGPEIGEEEAVDDSDSDESVQ